MVDDFDVVVCGWIKCSVGSGRVVVFVLHPTLVVSSKDHKAIAV